MSRRSRRGAKNWTRARICSASAQCFTRWRRARRRYTRRDDRRSSHEAILGGPRHRPKHGELRGIPHELDRIIGKALEKDRDLRYQRSGSCGRGNLKRVKRDTEPGGMGGFAAAEGGGGAPPRPWLFGVVAVILLAVAVFYQVWKPAGLFRTSSPPAQPTHRQITFVGDALYPALSPDGKSIAYVTGKTGQQQRLMLQDLKGGQAIEISKALGIAYPRWSPDGSELAFFLYDPPQQYLFLIPRLGGSARFIARGAFSCWSPDGSQIATAVLNDVGFRIVDQVTRSAKSIRSSGFLELNDLDWSPASDLLAVLTKLGNGRDAIWTVHPDGSEQRKVIEENGLASPRWSAAGDGIYFLHTSQGQTQELLKVAINPKSGQAKDSASVLLSGLQTGGYFTVSMDGTRLAYSRSQNYSNLWLAQFQSPDDRMETGKGLQTTSLTRGTSRFDSPSFSPDGKWIAFVTEEHISREYRPKAARP